MVAATVSDIILEEQMVQYVWQSLKAATFWTNVGHDADSHKRGAGAFQASGLRLQKAFEDWEQGQCELSIHGIKYCVSASEEVQLLSLLPTL